MITRNLNDNCWLPHLGKVSSIDDLGPEIKLLRVHLANGNGHSIEEFQPGQFAFISAFGVGEAPFGIASILSDDGSLEFAIQRLGNVTTALHEMAVGDLIGVRGPLGNSFPMEEFEGKNLVVIGGGIGGAPLRPVIQHIDKNRNKFGELTILWAARSPSHLMFREDYDHWRDIANTNLYLTVDQSDGEWDGHVGLITELIEQVNPSSKNAIAITCGPPVMIYYVDKLLSELGFSPDSRYVTLEARMHCGIGKCGRCNIGEKYVCVDGPVFSMDEVENFLEGYF
jgi:NAD(P)H-flavin reductase